MEIVRPRSQQGMEKGISKCVVSLETLLGPQITLFHILGLHSLALSYFFQ